MRSPFPWTDDDGGGEPEDRSDFRDRPASDKGNSSYKDHGNFGTYQTRADQFPDPEGVRHFTGYGADEADLVRGFKEVAIRGVPAYQMEDYKFRSTEPKLSDIDEGGDGDDALPDDYTFRRKNRQSRGFLTRPHTPTDR